jgi:putative transposase
MFTKRTYKFRLYLTKKQRATLQHILDECRFLYNLCLEQRKLAYEELDMSLTKVDQLMMLPLLKEDRPSLRTVHSQLLQDVVIRLDKAFEGFFRRCSSGEKPGFPRFKSVSRYNSFTYPQSGFSIVGNELKLSKIGSFSFKLHRPIEGKIKTCTLRCDASGNWFVCFSCEVESSFLSANEKAVGIDMGVDNWAYFSDGKVIKNPRFFKKDGRALAKAQRKLASQEKGSAERKKQRKVVAKIHERIRNRRSNFCHQVSRAIVNEYQYICVEELEIQKMVEGSILGHHMSRSIADASWDQFCRFLSYKAEDAGRKIGFVNPAYTTQDCSKCGFREKKKLSQRSHACCQCGYTAPRDLNAAENILALGLDGLGMCPRSSCLQAGE